MTRRGRRAAIGVASILFGVSVLSGCSGAGGDNGPGGSLLSAMGAVQASPISRASFAWSDQHALRLLSGVTSAAGASNPKKVNPTWSRLADVALPALVGLEPQVTTGTGIDRYAGSRAMTVGLAGERAGRVDGADVATVAKRFKALGAPATASGGRTAYVLAPDEQVDLGNAHLGGDVYLAINRVVIKGSAVAFGLAGPPVDVALGGGRSLADDPEEAAVAECLGDVVVAQVWATPTGAAPGVTMIGAGVRRTSAPTDRPREVLCEVAGVAQVDNVTAALAQGTQASALLPVSGVHARDRVAQATVDQVRKGDLRVARLTIDLVAPARAGVLLLDEGLGGMIALGGGGTPSATGS